MWAYDVLHVNQLLEAFCWDPTNMGLANEQKAFHLKGPKSWFW